MTLPFRLCALTGSFLCAALVASCSGSAPAGDDHGRATPSDLRIEPGALRGVLNGLSQFQADLLQDGVLTFSEYESAIFSAVKCEEDAGLTIFAYPIPGVAARPGPELTARGEYQYLPRPVDGPSGAALHRAYDDCEATYAATLRQLWAGHVAPTAKEMQAARDSIATCLRDHDIKAPQHPSGDELMQLAYPPNGVQSQPRPDQPYLGCAEAAAATFGIPGYIGQ